jgi:hypothetical protein
MEDESEIFDGLDMNDETEIDPGLVPKPALCLSCKKDNDPEEEELCLLTRMDAVDGEDFFCGAYEKTR